jgi:hypothetical protein
MSSVLSPPSHPLPVAPVLDAALRLFRAALLRCLPYGALTVIASQLPHLYNLVNGLAGRPFAGAPLGWWAVNIVSALLEATFWNAILLRMDSVAAGRPVRIAAELGAAGRRAPAVILLILVLATFSAVLAAPALLLPAALRPSGIALAAIAVIYLLITLSCSWVSLVLDNRGVLQSLADSVQLVRGNWWRVAVVLCVGLVMLVVLAALGSVLVVVVVPLVGGDDIAVITSTSVDVVVALAALAIPFCVALLFTLTSELKACREAFAGSAEPRNRVRS